jgi:pSer/pThr/pTyr-binding forkhead associated (FHA) protein
VGPADKGTLSRMQDRRRGPGGLVVHVGSATTPLPRGEWVIGRAPAADVRIDDDRVSRRHALVRYGVSGWELVDGGSLNGIWLAGRQVQRIPVPPGGLTVLVGGKDGVPVRLAPDRSSVAPEPSDPGAAGPGPGPAPGTSPAGVRFQEVTPEWTGWRTTSPSERVPNGSAVGRWRSIVRRVFEAARARGRRGDGD